MHKILVANRGEIAIRICRTLREMGIQSIAIYSEADWDSSHVFAADEAHPVGPAPAARSYLDAERIVETALTAKADAIHPGYGFLSESAGFAERVRSAGLTWIGPSPEAIRALGDKLSARVIAGRAGVPVLPGTDRPVSDLDELRRAAEAIGYPVVLKAAAGGGGKGMRRVNAASEFEQALRLTQGEAKSAFGDDRIYLERWLEKPRHIEVQILADEHGHAIALGDRDCSIQRRHQKLVEETPSPRIDEARRAKLWDLAVRVAREGGYTNAGTAEFLLDQRGDFHFLEVNARLQVEHPITEMVLGLDLVREQVRVASGEPLSLDQGDVRPAGASIEFRLYAEDPDAGFLPQAGTIGRLELPAGPGVRCDIGVRAGGTVPIHYDPLIGKVIVWGASRGEALARSRRALRECVLEGIRTTVGFHLWLLAQEPFRSGNYDTAYLAHAFTGTAAAESPQEIEDAAALAAVFACATASVPRFAEGVSVQEREALAASRWRLAHPNLRVPPARLGRG